MHPKTVCRELVVLLQDPTPSVRAAAAYALGKMKSHRARRWLIQTLADPEADVRRAAAWALGMLSGPHGAQPLQAVALEDRDETVRLEALRALRRLDWPSVESLLETVLQSDDPVRRARAIEQLGERGDFRAVYPLVEALTDPSVVVRSAAVQALGRLGATPAVLPLCAVVLRDEFAFVRAQAAWALGIIGSPCATDSLLRAMDDAQAWVRAKSAEALGRLGDLRALPKLVHAIRVDREAAVRCEATKAVGRLLGRAEIPEPARPVSIWSGVQIGIVQENGSARISPQGRVSWQFREEAGPLHNPFQERTIPNGESPSIGSQCS